MAPIDLNLLRTFATVYEAGSFSAAAKRLGVPRSTVSRAITALEAHVGEPLVHRTTRTMAISEAGVQLFDRIAPAIGGLATALADLPRPVDDEPRGLVRVTATADLAAAVLAEAAVRFTARYPQTQVELRLTASVVDLVRDGVDLALRIVKRRLPDSALIARRVGALVFQLFAAPSYLARHGTPRATAELAAHDWIGFHGVAPTFVAPLRQRGFVPGGRIVCDDMFIVRELLRRGGGIGGMPSFLADDDLASGALVRVLPRFTMTSAAVYLVHAARRPLPTRVTAFRDLVGELLRQRPLERIS